MKKKVILLTGIPSSGKTTATDYVRTNFENIKVVRYGELLFRMKEKTHPGIKYEQMRSQSGSILSKEDLAGADDLILKTVIDHKGKFDIIIESHGVTKEDYGFRITPYKNVKKLVNLGVTNVVYISSDSDIIVKRMLGSAKGRKKMNQGQIQQNFRLQETLALVYAVLTGSTFTVIENNSTLTDFKKKLRFTFNQILQT
jgi:adenylate kinase